MAVHVDNIRLADSSPELTDSSGVERALALANERGIVRPRDLAAADIPRDYLWRLHKSGHLERMERGLYTVPQADATENRGLVIVAKRVPKGVVCLLSALRFHGLTT
jgi:predicted transcriptional regulator of viral defense system